MTPIELNKEVEFIKQEGKQWLDYEKKLEEYYKSNKQKIELAKQKLCLRYSICEDLRRR